GSELRTRLSSLADAGAGEAIKLVELPFAEADHVYHLFVVRSANRDALRAHLEQQGVASAIHYPSPIHRTEAYAHLGLVPGSLPVSERLSEQICSLPLFPGMTDDELSQVSQAMLSFAKASTAAQR
ncbi:MAG TPA: DegT/DnrJ/EryC1/StrS family aminotransferase, partial [Solirubrobacteraceae bacterium]|nr:DegT/DnrJ/EryC1/StrS family aminotransferase [Solirubrobacteraceae bacterium]